MHRRKMLPSPEVVAMREAAIETHKRSRKGWMETARLYAGLIFFRNKTLRIAECIQCAKSHSVSVRELKKLRPKVSGTDFFSRCSCGSKYATIAGNPNPGGRDEYCPTHGQDIR